MFIRIRGKQKCVQFGFDPALLCDYKTEVSLNDGEMVLLPVENTGRAARGVTVKLDGVSIVLEREIDIEGAHGLTCLMYPYEKAKHGMEQRITLSFESESGEHDTHTYLTKHGCRQLNRINPPLPQ